MKSAWSIVFVSSILLIASEAFGISRVGNRLIGDPTMKAFTSVPIEYSAVETLTETTLRLKGIGLRRNVIQAMNFGIEYPKLKNFGREELRNYFESSQWQTLPHANACVDVYQKEMASTLTTIVVWGQSLGFVFASDNSQSSVRALRHMAENLKIEADSCQWN